MRYVVAGLLIVAGLIVGAIGVLQKTVWAPPEEIVAQAAPDDPGPLLVIEPGVLNLYQGPAQLIVRDEGEISISQASMENVDAWVGETEHTSVTGLADESTLALEKVDGEPEAPNPLGADLFEAQTSGQGEAAIEWDNDPGRTAFLVATDGQAPAASAIEIRWPNDTETPWAVPLMIAGGILVALGVVLGIMDVRRGQEERKRGDARAPRGRKVAGTGAAFAIVPVLALAGCGTPELPTAQPSDPPASAPPVVNESQLERIVTEISTAVAAADEETDAAALQARATGPFLEQRTSAYEVKQAAEDYPLPPAVAADDITVNVVSATDQWPRVTSAITTDAESGQAQFLVLSQEDPRANYRLWSQSVLLPGAEIPEVADARQGSQLLAPDQDGLAKTPQQAVRHYAAVLQNGEDSWFFEDFADDAFRQQVAETQQSQRDALAEGNATISYDYSTDGSELVAQQTADGAAIVTGLINVTTTVSPESVEDRTGTLTVPEPQRSIVGETETSQQLVTRNLQVVTFTVPTDGQVALIGVTDVLAGAELQ